MGLKKAENQVKILLAETILSMCRNTLPYHAEICVEGLLGITLDNEEIFLVNINQTIKNQIEGPSAASKANESLKRSRKEQDNEGSESDPESSSNESEESSSKKRRKRGRRKKQKGEKSGSESDDGNLADESANVEATSLLPGADLTEVKFHNISPPDENPDGSEQYYDNSNQTADNDSQDATPSGVNVTVKQEPPGGPESDDDLVFVKQEVDDFNLAQPSSHQFSNLSQVFGNSSADTSLSQPDFMSSAFFNNPANNMSANAMQQAAVPGPSGANAGAQSPTTTTTTATASSGQQKVKSGSAAAKGGQQQGKQQTNVNEETATVEKDKDEDFSFAGITVIDVDESEECSVKKEIEELHLGGVANISIVKIEGGQGQSFVGQGQNVGQGQSNVVQVQRNVGQGQRNVGQGHRNVGQGQRNAGQRRVKVGQARGNVGQARGNVGQVRGQGHPEIAIDGGTGFRALGSLSGAQVMPEFIFGYNNSGTTIITSPKAKVNPSAAPVGHTGAAPVSQPGAAPVRRQRYRAPPCTTASAAAGSPSGGLAPHPSTISKKRMKEIYPEELTEAAALRRCKLCGKEFPEYQIAMHMRIHSGERPFKCSLCGRDFVLKHKLKSHWIHAHKLPWKDEYALEG